MNINGLEIVKLFAWLLIGIAILLGLPMSTIGGLVIYLGIVSVINVLTNEKKGEE